MTKKQLEQTFITTLSHCYSLYNDFIVSEFGSESFDGIYEQLDEAIDLALSIKYLLANFDEIERIGNK